MLGWRALKIELERWRRQGRRPRLWWRDDDARAPGPQLRRLLVHATRADVPLCLAVIPYGLDPDLCAAVAPYVRVTILQHGFDHLNKAGAAPSEFSPADAPEQVAARLADGWARLDGFERRLPVYVPPWNSLTPNVEAALVLCGNRAVSAWSQLSSPGRVDTHVDLMRWRGEPRFAGRERVLARLTAQLHLRRRFGAWEEPVGLLTHHLVHDEDAWRFLDDLLLFPPLQADAEWPDAAALFGISNTFAKVGPAPIQGVFG